MFDLFAVRSELHYLKSQRFSSSTTGKIVTLLLILSIIAVTVLVFDNALKRRNPTTTISNQVVEIPDALSLSKGDFQFTFSLTDNRLYQPYIDLSIYTPFALLIYREIVTLPDGRKDLITYNVSVDLEPCNRGHVQIPEKFQDDMGKTFCISKTQTYIADVALSGLWESPKSWEFYIAILKCNNLLSKVPCAAPQVIDATVDNAAFSFNYVDISIDPGNFENPVKRFKNSLFTPIGPNMAKQGMITLKQLSLSTDVGFISSSYENGTYHTVDTLIETATNSVPFPGTIVYMKLRNGRNVQMITRTYPKILDVFSQINGFYAVFYLVFRIILKPFSRYKYNESLVNRLFDIDLVKKLNLPQHFHDYLRKKLDSAALPLSQDDQSSPRKKPPNKLEILADDTRQKKHEAKSPTLQDSSSGKSVKTRGKSEETPTKEKEKVYELKLLNGNDANISPKVDRKAADASIIAESYRINTQNDVNEDVPPENNQVKKTNFGKIDVGIFEFYFWYVFRFKKISAKLDKIKQGTLIINRITSVESLLEYARVLDQLKLALLSSDNFERNQIFTPKRPKLPLMDDEIEVLDSSLRKEFSYPDMLLKADRLNQRPDEAKLLTNGIENP